MLSWSGYTPNLDGWLPKPLVEDRSHFGMACITSSPLILSFNVTNNTLVQLLWVRTVTFLMSLSHSHCITFISHSH